MQTSTRRDFGSGAADPENSMEQLVISSVISHLISADSDQAKAGAKVKVKAKIFLDV